MPRKSGARRIRGADPLAFMTAGTIDTDAVYKEVMRAAAPGPDFGRLPVDGVPSCHTEVKLKPYPRRNIRYDHALDLARELRLDKGQAANVLVSGNFVFGDFLEAYAQVHGARYETLRVSSLSFTANNVDSFRNLMDAGRLGRLDLFVSAYFHAHERYRMIRYCESRLENRPGCRFRLVVARLHAKLALMETTGGRKITMQGSANLGSSACVEQFTIEEDEATHDFYAAALDRAADAYAANGDRAQRLPDLWETMGGDR